MFLRSLELSPKAQAKLDAAGLAHPDIERAFMAARWYLLKMADKSIMVLAGTDPPMYIYKHTMRFHSVEYFLIRYTLIENHIMVHDIKVEP